MLAGAGEARSNEGGGGGGGGWEGAHRGAGEGAGDHDCPRHDPNGDPNPVTLLPRPLCSIQDQSQLPAASPCSLRTPIPAVDAFTPSSASPGRPTEEQSPATPWDGYNGAARSPRVPWLRGGGLTEGATWAEWARGPDEPDEEEDADWSPPAAVGLSPRTRARAHREERLLRGNTRRGEEEVRRAVMRQFSKRFLHVMGVSSPEADQTARPGRGPRRDDDDGAEGLVPRGRRCSPPRWSRGTRCGACGGRPVTHGVVGEGEWDAFLCVKCYRELQNPKSKA